MSENSFFRLTLKCKYTDDVIQKIETKNMKRLSTNINYFTLQPV